MPLSMRLGVLTCPALLGAAEVIRQGQSKGKREEHRARRCNLIVTCIKSFRWSRELDTRQVVLRDNKLYIDTGTYDGFDDEKSKNPLGHPFSGYYLRYPDTKYEGLISTIVDDPPILNWIYVDAVTHELKYGGRLTAQSKIVGSHWKDGRGFVAVEEIEGLWAIYFDRYDNGLKGIVKPGKRVLEIELARKEKAMRPRKQYVTTELVVVTKLLSSKENGIKQEETSGYSSPTSLAEASS
ncbi:hypothetical protein AJ80_03595 [Polytolypa hystricis UAMH7299]|uniref:Uncharacterized protein n=1 Tax=Polytolypa hystricis (strain UAMH7299) TaxID=1447883 RepID=A0A2B7YHE0_POLH7|nr:hypothetical protein AJ80_03595 [Polytolypa hystricis UAMH7299]